MAGQPTVNGDGGKRRRDTSQPGGTRPKRHVPASTRDAVQRACIATLEEWFPGTSWFVEGDRSQGMGAASAGEVVGRARLVGDPEPAPLGDGPAPISTGANGDDAVGE